MTKPIFISHLYLSLFLHMIIATTLVAADPAPIYTPVEDITVKCGYSGQLFNHYDKRYWSGDINSKFTPLDVHQAAGSNSSMFKEAPSGSSVSQIPYTTVRLSRSEFTYRFNLTAGQKFIRLYFYPFSYPDFDSSKALFSVKAGGFTLLDDFNASVNADAYGVETLYREFCINIEEEEQSINITFTPSKASPDAYAFINGIEIVSMPPNLYYTAPKDPYRIKFIPAGTGNKKKVFLSITLQPHPQHRKTRYLDAIVNGLEIFKLSETNGNLAGPDPDPPLPPPPPPPKVIPSSKKHTNSRTHLFVVVAGAVSAMLVVLSVLGLLLVFRHRRKYAKGYEHSSHRAVNSTKSRDGSSLTSDLCHYFSLKEIKAATENFNDTFIIGVGGFGNVYKGYIDDGATPVAIKRLKPESSQGANEFKTEIELLSQLRHRHLVSLIGYCTDQNEMVLVYDYMSRGTLADNLYHSDNPPLAWGLRLQICIGAARGLRYLHSGAKATIIHRDVKSTNILLDEKWVAKVSDFGLSKTGMTTASKTHISTMVKGSFGYLDPEYYRRQQLTEKSDVYSFGVVLWEVLCARPALMHKVEPREMNLAEWARSCHGEGTLDQIIDCNLKGKIEVECLNMFIEIAMSCIHDKGVERPSMNEVVRGLEFALQLHQKSIGSNGDCGVTTEQGCASNESIQCISATIFSEINDPYGR